MEKYCEIVSFKIAKILDNRVSDYSDTPSYAGEDGVEGTTDNNLGVRKYKEGQLIEYEDYIYGKYYKAPTYAEVFDWLSEKYNIVIEMIPVYTFALNDRTGYFYTVWKRNDNDSKYEQILRDEDWFGSFENTIENIIVKLKINGVI